MQKDVLHNEGPAPESMLQKASPKIVLVLYNIRSIHNVGALFRVADGAGVSKIYLVGYTPTPIDRFGRVRKDLQKTALGAEESVLWEYVKIWEEARDSLRESEYILVAVEQNSRSIPYTNTPADRPVAIILGPEVEGLPQEVLKEVDVIAEIPMMGKKESLNVATAGAIVLYDILRRQKTFCENLRS
jgi:tRNA G18 (ribose-2'-O)-methylase SpoU